MTKYVRDIDAYRSLVGHLLPRAVLHSEPYSLTVTDLEFSKTDLGKPSVTAENLRHFEFNVSHDSQWVVGAYSSSTEISAIGIDTMHIGVPWREGKVVELFETMESLMTNFEIARYRSAPDQLLYLIKLWAHKEAWAKAIGTGLCTDWTSAEFHFTADATPTFYVNDSIDTEWSFHEIQLAFAQLCVIATYGRSQLDSHQRSLTWTELLELTK